VRAPGNRRPFFFAVAVAVDLDLDRDCLTFL
jgi:hypothetical protein